MSQTILRKYGEATTFLFHLFETDGIDFKIDAVYVSGDVKLMKDEGTEANVDSGFTDEGQGYSQPLTATEMEFARGKVYIADQGTKAWLDTGIIIETYGHASAQHPYFGEGVWDRSLTGSTHNAPTSAGRRLRSLGDVVSASVNDASAGVASFITDLTGGHDDHYADQTLLFTSGNLAGMSRSILEFNNSTKLITIEEDLPEAPADGDDFDINPVHIHPVSQIVQEVWDRVLTMGNHNIQNSAGKILRELKEISGYEGGFIYYDSTGGGSAGSEDFINGILENPVDNMADLNILAASLNISSFRISAGSIVTLTASQERQIFSGEIWTLNLGGQSISGSTFHGANISGIATGAIKPNLEHSHFGNVTLPPCHMDLVGFEGILTLGSAGAYFMANDCHSAIAGLGAPCVDFGVAIGDSQINLRGYSGGIELLNMGQNGTDTASIEGDGQVIINANSIGGTIAIRGHQTITGAAAFKAAGGVISDDARFDINHNIPVITSAAAGEIPYAEDGAIQCIVQGDAVGIPFSLTGDFSSNRLFFGAKTAIGETAYIMGDVAGGPDEIEITGHSYDGDTGKTTGVIIMTALQTTVSAVTLKAEVESRDPDGLSNPLTPLKLDLHVKGEIITAA